MRVLIIAATMAITGSAFGAGPDHFQLRNASDLVKICSTQTSDSEYASAIAFCHGFLAGAYRYYLAATPEPDRFVCAPNPAPTRTKVMNDFVGWVKARPQNTQDQPADMLFRYLAEVYPCKK